ASVEIRPRLRPDWGPRIAPPSRTKGCEWAVYVGTMMRAPRSLVLARRRPGRPHGAVFRHRRRRPALHRIPGRRPARADLRRGERDGGPRQRPLPAVVFLRPP